MKKRLFAIFVACSLGFGLHGMKSASEDSHKTVLGEALRALHEKSPLPLVHAAANRPRKEQWPPFFITPDSDSAETEEFDVKKEGSIKS